jgi:hypothetical protein
VRRWALAALVASAALAFGGCGVVDSGPPTVPVTFSTTTTTPTSTVPAPTSKPYIGPEGIAIETGPFLAAATTTQLGTLVNRIQCESLAQLAYSAYAHLQVYVDGRSRALPGGIGMVGTTTQPTQRGLVFTGHTCTYWLHTRAADGLILIESPVPRQYTLGDFFRIWHQPLGSDRVAGARGPVTATVNGKRWHGDPTEVPLTEHADIELAVGRPVPAPTLVDWAATGF